MLEIIQLAIRKEGIDKAINALKRTVKRSRGTISKTNSNIRYMWRINER
jgi:hypothetical protein